MIFIANDVSFSQPGWIVPVRYPEVQAAGRPESYQGRQMLRVNRIGTKKQTEPGFSSILAEEEDAILTRLQSA